MEIAKGDKLGREGGSQEQPRMEIMKGGKLRRQGGQRQPRAAQNGDHEERQASETRRAAATKSSPENGDEGGQVWETRREWQHDHLAISGGPAQSLGNKNPTIECGEKLHGIQDPDFENQRFPRHLSKTGQVYPHSALRKYTHMKPHKIY